MSERVMVRCEKCGHPIKRRAPQSRTMSIERLREVLAYDPNTGALTWRVDIHAGVRAGAVTGSLGESNGGYGRISLGGKGWLAHRVAWAIFYGRWPHCALDHINRDKGDNRICNLREVTPSENARNCERIIRRGPGSLGTTKIGENRWQAAIKYRRKWKYLGTFNRQEDAHAAYLAERARIERATQPPGGAR